MTRDEKKAYNFANEDNYYFAPFTPQRLELRKQWGTSRKDWNSFLYEQERQHQKKQQLKD